MNNEKLLKAYDAYVARFHDASGKLPKMMELKRLHTDKVVENAMLIAAGEKLNRASRTSVYAAALLHDVGRYHQLKRYNTFRDADSIDHAALSSDIVAIQGWLVGRSDEQAIRDAISFHNRAELPPDVDSRTELIANVVRDADKLDIFRVLEDEVRNSDWRKDTRAFWNLPVDAPPSPLVVKAILAMQPVPYRHIKSLADFVLIQVGWMLSGLRFETSRRLCRERGHLAFRREFLHQITDSPAVDKICDLVELDLAPLIDHTFLSPDRNPKDLPRICREAKKYGFASVCVYPDDVERAVKLLKGSPVKVCAVIDFPLGKCGHKAKMTEVVTAIVRGAQEIDCVVNQRLLKAFAANRSVENMRKIAKDLLSVVVPAKTDISELEPSLGLKPHRPPVITKLILECCNLTHDEKVVGCVVAKTYGFDFVKTSTGFGSGGATVDDVRLLCRCARWKMSGEYVNPNIGVKAAGGIRTREQALAMVAAGATRLGCSASLDIIGVKRAR